MKGLAVCSKGIEDVCSSEIKELIKAKAIVKDRCIIFDFKKYEELCLLCYKAQSVDRVLFLFDNFKIDNEKIFDQIKEKIKKINLKDWLTKKRAFRVSSSVVNNEVSSEELNGKVGEIVINHIKAKYKYKQKVNLDNPDITFFVFLNNKDCYLGIDFSGFSLFKRTYKIFNHPSALRGTIGYALVRIAGYKTGIMLDPFTGSGVIPIEASMFVSGFPVNYFNKDKFSFLKFLKIDSDKFFEKIDKGIKSKKYKILGYDSQLMCVTSSKKNAKIAGINKFLTFSRIEVEWLDTKMAKESVDRIVTHPPELGKHVNVKDIEKLYNEFFHQAEFVLKKNGKIVLISREGDLLKKYAEKNGFKLKEERDVYSGKQVLRVMVFIK